MRPLTTLRLLPALTLVAALAAATLPAPAHAASGDYTAPIPLAFPVDGDVRYSDDYHSCRSDCSRRHKATDVMAAYGQTVRAAVGGEITFITGLDGSPPPYGYMIYVRGDDGRRYEYVHLGRQDGPPSEAYAGGLREGSRVQQGQVLGKVGCSGNASCAAPHLHFAIKDPGVRDPYGSDYRNPYESLRQAEGAAATSASPSESVVLSGDFNGDGHATPARVDAGRFHVCLVAGDECEQERRFRYGRAGDVPVVGDWDGDGTDGIGVVRGRDWHLRQTASGGGAEASFVFGRAGDEPVVGDFDGDGRTTAGLRRDGRWFLRLLPGGGKADLVFGFGKASDDAVTGDWDGDGTETVGVVRGRDWHLNDRNGGGRADRSFRYGAASGDEPVAGDWTHQGHAGVGVVRSGVWHLRSEVSGGPATRSIEWP